MKDRIKFKAILRIAGIIALITIIGFTMAACGGGGGVTTYSVTYNGNGHDGGSVPISVPYLHGETVIVGGNPGFLTKSGYYFIGWNTKSDGNGTLYSMGNTFVITTDVVLYAQWGDASVPRYTLTYNGNGNTGGEVPLGSGFEYAGGVPIIVLGNTGFLTKTGYTFAGWNTNAAGTGTTYNAPSTLTLTSNTTLYAKWTSNTPLNYTLDGIWWSEGGEKVSVSGATGTVIQFGSLSPLGTDAVKKGHYNLDGQKWRSLAKTGNQTWSGQVLHILYNSSNPNVSLGTTWSDCTITMSSDGETITFAAADSSGAYSYDYTRTYTPTNYSLEGLWEETTNGSQITVSGTGGVRTRWPHAQPDAFHIDARSKGYSALGQQVWRTLTSTGTRTWSGDVLHISFYLTDPNVAVGTQWTPCTITMSEDANIITFSSNDYNGPYTFTYTRTLTPDNPEFDSYEGTLGLTFTPIPNSTNPSAYSVSKGTASANTIVIPYLYNGLPVTTITANGFENATMSSIEIPGSITTIGASAFSNCTSLRSIIVPISVRSIGSAAFRDCTYLESISLPFVGNTFDGTSNTYFGYIFGKAAYNSSTGAIPASLKTVVITGGSIFRDNVFRNCASLESITIPDSVTNISNYAFNGCSNLKNFVIPDDSVTIIGTYVFQNCVALQSITLGNKLTSIGNYAFDGCTVLGNFTIPSTVASIGTYAFRDCKALTNVIIPNNVTSIGTNAFQNCTVLASVTISNRVTSISGYLFAGCSVLNNVIIPEGVTSIGGQAFQNCTGLNSIVIPSSVNTLAYQTFGGCTGLTGGKVYYGGADETAWNGIGQITNSTNKPFVDATRYYASQWSFVDGVPTAAR